MLFTIVFNDGVTLDTSDAETAIRACNFTDRISAVVNAETKEVLFGGLPWCMLSEEERERETRMRKRAFMKKRESQYKKAYLEYKLYANARFAKTLASAERDCLNEGLTDVILHLANEQCDARFKLFNRGLINTKELLDVHGLQSVILD